MPDKGYPENRKKWPKVLAFDTSGPFICAGGATESYTGGLLRDMPKGQAEALFPIVEDFLASSNWGWSDVDAIGVATGPGNFTGIRIAVSAARGLGFALKIPVFGITQFELASETTPIQSNTLVSVPAPRDMAYVYGVGLGTLAGEALLIDPAAPPPELQLPSGMTVYGHRGKEIAAHFDAAGHDKTYRPDPGRMASITQTKYREAGSFPPRPTPNYIKPPDAAPARDKPPTILT